MRDRDTILPPRAVFFDMGGTLAYPYPSFHALIARICQEHGLAVTEVEAARAEPAVWTRIAERADRGRGFTTSMDRSRGFWLWVYQTFLREMGRHDAAATTLPERLLDAFLQLENYRLYADARPVLEQLHASGVILGVISNWESWLERLMAHLDIGRYFEVVIASGQAGVEKPDAAIFHQALAAARVGAHEAVHIGDSVRDDVEGAAAVGIRPVLVDRGLELLGDGQAGPYHRVRTLLDLPGLLGLD